MTTTMSRIDPELVPPRSTSLYHTFPQKTTATRIMPFASGEWLVETSVLRKSQSTTGLWQRQRHVPHLSRMGSLDDIARHVGNWGEKRDTVDTVYAIAENGWFDEEKEEAQQLTGRDSREHEDVALPTPSVPRKSSKRQKTRLREAVRSPGLKRLTELLTEHRAQEAQKYDIFGKHLQSEQTYSENKRLGFEHQSPGSKQPPIIHAALDQDQQEAIKRLESPPPPADWGISGAATEQVRRKRQELKTKRSSKSPVRRDFAPTAEGVREGEVNNAEVLFNAILASTEVKSPTGLAVSAEHKARKEAVGLARVRENALATARKIDREAAKAHARDQDQPRSCFEQGKSRKVNLQPAALLTKLKSVHGRKAQGNKPTQHHNILEGSKTLMQKLKHSLSTCRRASPEPAGAVQAQAQARADFESEQQKLLHEIHIARRTKHQRWLEAEQEMARAQDRSPIPIPPVQPVVLDESLETDARIAAKALDISFDATPSSQWRANSQVTKITTSARNGSVRIIGPPEHGAWSVCVLWLDRGHMLRAKALEHMQLIMQDRLPKDHLVSGCDCYLYRIYDALTNNDYRWIGVARTSKENEERLVVHLAKEKPVLKYMMGERMPSAKITNVPE